MTTWAGFWIGFGIAWAGLFIGMGLEILGKSIGGRNGYRESKQGGIP